MKPDEYKKRASKRYWSKQRAKGTVPPPNEEKVVVEQEEEEEEIDEDDDVDYAHIIAQLQQQGTLHCTNSCG
jgi:hypothetical protein